MSQGAASLPARDPQPRTRYDAVLLVSFGGPEGQDDVLPFLRNVTRGRGIPDERLEEVAHHYRHFGGVSPINDQNRALRAALTAELDRRGLDLPVYWGNRNWDPYLSDALRAAHAAGHRRLLAVVTSAYSSYSSCRQYREDLAAALEETGLTAEVQVDKVRQYFDHPGFVGPFVSGTRDAIRTVLDEIGPDAGPGDVHVLFSTHSIPTVTAVASGPPTADLGPDGAYGAQHRAVAEVVMAALASGTDAIEVDWSLVFQSRSGSPHTPWLEPDVNDAIGELASRGVRGVVIVPLGFVSDHMEVVWDLDEEATATARDAGLAVSRVPTPGVDPTFVTGLVDLVEERHTTGEPDGPVDRPALTPLGPWYDVCRAGCCANPRGERPAVAGLA
ncbi:ferrochelatase [Isoptericola sp. b441]|uniref:Coproporphyrin III ferrochelatase n=1 Tax=Actinotalea lenta TaxID=3064654 RepID=A0ABT9DAL3_9CELL|nr:MULTISPECIES: ferrochelatase [unclassified Isoptericola]MDO8106228.1 ferrochelatase [Isoptericola sp. b441]MDO8122052.1 ferrochelatase [Isoptericola sp. b490]